MPPQATDEDRAKMGRYFGDEIGMSAPLAFLKLNGWRDNAGILSTSKPCDQITIKELDCVYFLCDEWDFGLRLDGIPA